MSSTPHRRNLTAVCVVCTTSVLLLYLFVAPFRSLETAAGDWLATNPAARLSPRNPQLIYLGIDKPSIDLDAVWDEDFAKSPTLRLMKEGFPWNRGVYAAVAERVLGSGAKAVVFDILFPSPHDEDATFKAALDRFADRVVIGSNFETAMENSDAAGGGALNNKPTLIPPSATLIPRDHGSDSRVGFANVIADEDGKVRRMRFRTTVLEFAGKAPRAGDEELFSLAARALQKAGAAERIPATHDPVALRFAEPILPTSLYQIFVEDVWKKPPFLSGALFKDKIVVVGAAGNAAEDRLQTPHGTALGPTIHLSAINAALNHDFLHETNLAENLALIVASGLLAWLLGAKIRRPMVRLAVLAAAIVGFFSVAQILFNIVGFLPVLLSPLLALGGSGLTWSVWEQVLDLREKARMRQTMERYISRDVVKELVDNPQGWLNTLVGQRKNITVLFSDVRGFTTITESGDEHALVLQLNEYFDAMVNIVFANHGTLDKFIGDAVMAQWGGIVSEGEKVDACRAVGAAVAMRKALVRLNPGWIARGMIEIKFGIGINHGEAIVGNLGAEARKEVTAIGDVVNTASRLEGMTKEFHVDLLIGGKVAALVRDEFFVRTVALSQPKGKTKPLEIFTVIDVREGGEEPAWLSDYERGVQLYRQRDFLAAKACFEAALQPIPGDWLATDYLAKCAAFIAQPPPPDWNAVHVMTSK